MARYEMLIRVVALSALVCGGVYLGWRAINTSAHAQPASSLLIYAYACELFGWLLLAFLWYHTWRNPMFDRPPTGCLPTVGIATGTVDDVDVNVRFLDLAPDGAALVSRQPIELGRTVDLVAELPQVDDSIRAALLRLTVTACRPDPDPSVGWRVSGTLVPRHAADRHAVLEYCHVVAERNRLSGRGRLRSAGPPGRRPGDLGFEELWLAVARAAQG